MATINRFLISGFIFLLISGMIYYCANLSTSYNLPKGATVIGLGPTDKLIPTRTDMQFYVPDNRVHLEVTFQLNQFDESHFWAIFPYQIFEAAPYVIYQSYHYSSDETYKIGNVTLNFENFPEKSSSVINVTFVPNEYFKSLPKNNVTLSIWATVDNINSINYPLNSKQTTILSFYGNYQKLRAEGMTPYIGVNYFFLNDYPFRVTIQFPKDTFLSSDTFPLPIEMFVTEDWKSVMFDLDFTYPENYAQSISCSYVNPEREASRNFLTFISGAFFALGITLIFEPMIKTKTEDKEGMMEKKYPSLKNVIIFIAISISIFILVIIAQSLWTSEFTNSFLGLLSALSTAIIVKVIYDKIKAPNITTSVVEKPTIQNIPNTKISRGFYKILIRNKEHLIFNKLPAKGCRVKLKFKKINGKHLFTLSGKWDWTPEPISYTIANNKIVSIPAPALIPPSEFVDINSNEEEAFCILMKYDGEDDCYAFNGFSYLVQDLKRTGWKLGLGEYLVEIEFNSSNAHKKILLMINNHGNKVTDITINKISS